MSGGAGGRSAARDGPGKGLKHNGPRGWDRRFQRSVSGGSWYSAAASGGVPLDGFVSEWHLSSCSRCLALRSLVTRVIFCEGLFDLSQVTN